MARQALLDQLALENIHRRTQFQACRGQINGRQHVVEGSRRLGRRQIQVLHVQAQDARALAVTRQRLDRRTANQVFQLTHVARPVMTEQRLLRLRTQAQAAQPQAGAVLFEEVAGQQQHIATTLAQRRHRQRVNAQAVIQVGTKSSGTHLSRQVAVGGGDHPHVDAVFAIRTDPLQLPTLQHAQQLGLDRQRQLAHLVEKQAAAIGQLELAAALAHGPGKGATHMTEQLALHQRIGQRRTVDTDQRALRTWRSRVDRLSHQLLANPGLASDQHGERAVTDQANLVQQLAQRRALPDQLARLLASLLVQLGELALGLDPLRQAADALADLDRSRGQAGERIEAVQIEPTKAGWVE